MTEAIMVYFRAAKLLSEEDDSQDRARGVERRGSARCAVADGGTGAFRPGEWAGRLVDSFLGLSGNVAPSLRADDLDEWFGRMQQDWIDRPPSPPTTPYAAAKARGGSYATFVGCQIDGLDTPQPRWTAMAVGDSVLFHVRDGELLAQFPSITEFGLSPPVISTRPERRDRMRKDLRLRVGESDALRIGDQLFLATDAVAEWILGFHSPELWAQLAQLDHPEVFADWMTRCRRTRMMEDDDVTLLRVEIAEAAEWVKVAL